MTALKVLANGWLVWATESNLLCSQCDRDGRINQQRQRRQQQQLPKAPGHETSTPHGLETKRRKLSKERKRQNQQVGSKSAAHLISQWIPKLYFRSQELKTTVLSPFQSPGKHMFVPLLQNGGFHPKIPIQWDETHSLALTHANLQTNLLVSLGENRFRQPARQRERESGS